MKQYHELFPFNAVVFIFILFMYLASSMFGDNNILFILVCFWLLIAIEIVGGLMSYYKVDFPWIFLPVTITLLGVCMTLLGEQEGSQVNRIDLSNQVTAAFIGGGITVLLTVIGLLIKTWKDTKTINKIENHVEKVKTDVSKIDINTDDVHKDMLSKVLPRINKLDNLHKLEKLDKLDNISEFVTKIDVNTQNSGGDIKLIFSEVNKIILKVESLQKELEDEKRESRKREQNYMGQIAALRLENSKLKQRNREVEYFQGKQGHKHDQEPEL